METFLWQFHSHWLLAPFFIDELYLFKFNGTVHEKAWVFSNAAMLIKEGLLHRSGRK